MFDCVICFQCFADTVVECIEVFHNELSPAKQALSGPGFISVLSRFIYNCVSEVHKKQINKDSHIFDIPAEAGSCMTLSDSPQVL